MRKLLLLFALLPAIAFAQSAPRYDSVVQTASGQAVAGASIAVCTQPGTVTSTTPCSPLATLYPDSTGTIYSISSIVRSGNVVSVTTSASNSIPQGQWITIAGVSDTSFNGTFLVATAGNTFQFNQVGVNASSSGGTVSGANPTFSSGLGNYHFYAAYGNGVQYTVQIYAQNITTQIKPDQTYGTGSATPGLSSNNTWSGPNTYANNVTATAGQNAANAYVFNNVRYIDGNKYACSDVGLNAAIAALPATGGTVDARGCQGTSTIGATVTLGNSSSKLVTLILDRASFWQCTITNGTTCWDIFPGSGITMLGPGEGVGSVSGLGVSNSANVSNVILSETSNGTDRPLLDHVLIEGNSSATVTDAVVDLGDVLDGASINNLGIAGYTNATLLKITNANGSVGPADFNNFDIDCQGLTGCHPVLISGTANTNVFTDVNFHGGSFTHPGPGGIAIIDIEGTNGNGNTQGINLFGVQMESINSADIGVLANNAYGVAIWGANFTDHTNVGTAALKITGASGQITADNLTNYNNWTDTILNSATGGSTITAAQQARIVHYAYYGAGAGSANLQNVWEDQNGRELIVDQNGTTHRVLNFNETTAPSGVAGQDVCYGDSTAHVLKCQYNNAGSFLVVPSVIASGTAAMTTALITAPACGSTVTVSAPGVATTDSIKWSFNAAPAGTNAGLVSWPTSGNVNFAYCPGVTETPAAATINWEVIR